MDLFQKIGQDANTRPTKKTKEPGRDGCGTSDGVQRIPRRLPAMRDANIVLSPTPVRSHVSKKLDDTTTPASIATTTTTSRNVRMTAAFGGTVQNNPTKIDFTSNGRPSSFVPPNSLHPSRRVDDDDDADVEIGQPRRGGGGGGGVIAATTMATTATGATFARNFGAAMTTSMNGPTNYRNSSNNTPSPPRSAALSKAMNRRRLFHNNNNRAQHSGSPPKNTISNYSAGSGSGGSSNTKNGNDYSNMAMYFRRVSSNRSISTRGSNATSVRSRCLTREASRTSVVSRAASFASRASTGTLDSCMSELQFYNSSNHSSRHHNTSGSVGASSESTVATANYGAAAAAAAAGRYPHYHHQKPPTTAGASHDVHQEHQHSRAGGHSHAGANAFYQPAANMRSSMMARSTNNRPTNPVGTVMWDDTDSSTVATNTSSA